MMNTTGDIFNPAEQTMFEQEVNSGTPVFAIHSACDTEHEFDDSGRHEWPWIHEYIGAFFLSHPMPHNTQIMKINDKSHIATQHLPDKWEKYTEWYSFVYHTSMVQNQILIELTNESQEEPGIHGNYNNEAYRQLQSMGYFHPFCWCHERLPGRMFHTSLGHKDYSYEEDELFIKHVEGAMLWCIRRE